LAEFRTALEEKQDAGSRSAALMEGLIADRLSEQEQRQLIQNETRNTPDGLITNFGTVTQDGFFDEQVSTRTVEQQVQSTNENSSNASEARTNPLHEYVNYTYGISLSYLSLSKYNEVVVNGEEFIAKDGEVLIASAGRRNDVDMVRNARFERDMYFENFKMTTIIGHNNNTRGTNVIDLSFTIVEPYSITLLDKILQVAKEADILSWDQMPFVIKIDFFANTDDGPAPTPITELSKRFAIKIIDIKIKITNRGTEYSVSAIPMSRVAMLQSIATTPINLEIDAKNLNDFFDSGGSSGNVGVPEREQVLVDNEDLGIGVNETSEKDRQVSQANSYAAAMNAWQKKLVDKNHQKQADEYKFKFDDSIGSATLVPKSSGGAPLTSVPSDTAKIETNKLTTRINAGQSIIDVINSMIFSSSYYQNQIKPTDSVDSNPMKSHKILSTVEFVPGEYDSIRKTYKKIITYHVKEYSYFNQKSPHVRRSTPKTVEKEYNYLYTGKNLDVLSLDIDFNAMFYVAITALELKNEKVTIHKPNPEAKGDEAKDDELSAGRSDKIDPLKILPVPIQSESQTAQKSVNRKSIEATDLKESMMSSSRGDMLNVKLRIVGDPDLVKQDEVYYPPGQGSGTSIVMDAGEIHANLFFRTPEDVNQENGLYDFDDARGQNSFSGKYKIISVENVFERGNFTQTLDMIRLFEQDTSSSSKDSQRESTSDSNSADAEAQPGGFYGDKPVKNPGLSDESFVQDDYGSGGEIIERGGELVIPPTAEEIRLRTGFDLVQPRTVTDLDF